MKNQKKTIKNDETDRKKQGQMMKKREKTMKNDIQEYEKVLHTEKLTREKKQ